MELQKQIERDKKLLEEFPDAKIYYFNEVPGILTTANEAREHGLTELEQVNDIVFVPVNEIKEKGLNINEFFQSLAYSDAYGPGYIEPFNVAPGRLINAENSQRVIDDWEIKSFVGNEEYELEILTTTDKYCNWTSELTRFIDSYTEDYNKALNTVEEAEDEEEKAEAEQDLKELLDEMRKEWERVEAPLWAETDDSVYSVDRKTFEDVLEELKEVDWD